MVIVISYMMNGWYWRMGWDKQSIRVQANAGKSTIECIYLNPICNREINLF